MSNYTAWMESGVGITPRPTVDYKVAWDSCWELGCELGHRYAFEILLPWLMFVVYLALAQMVDHIPGACYTRMVPMVWRPLMLFHYGLAPKWAEIKNSPYFDHNGRYSVVASYSAGNMAHVMRVSHGQTIAELRHDLPANLYVGNRWRNPMPMIEAIYYAQTALKCSVVVAILRSRPVWLIILAVVALTRVRSVMTLDVPSQAWLAVVVMYVFRLHYDLGAFVLLAHGIERLAARTALLMINHVWSTPRTPSNKYEAVENGATKSIITYVERTANSHHTVNPVFKLKAMPANHSKEFFRTSGIAETVSVISKSKHPMARNLHNAALYHIFREFATTHTFWMIGTFTGMDPAVCGVATQANFGHHDPKYINDSKSEFGLNRLQCEAALGTGTSPIGSVKENYNPPTWVRGLPRSVAVLNMVHDVPIKAFLAAVSRSHCRVAFHVFLFRPSMLTCPHTELHHSGQIIKNDGTHLICYHKDTSDMVFRHPIGYFLEFACTDYVQTEPGVWYVSSVASQMCDVLTIRWDRTNVKPHPRKEISLTESILVDHVLLPYTCNNPDGTQEIRRMVVSKIIEDFVHRCKGIEPLAQNIRSLTDGMNTKQGMEMKHISSERIVQVWDAECLRKSFVAKIEANHNSSIFNLNVFGSNVTIRLVSEALRSLVSGEPERQTFQYLRQENSYVTPGEVVSPAYQQLLSINRSVGFSSNLQGQVFITQDRLDLCPTSEQFIIMKGDGESISDQVAQLLFGRTDLALSILPCGEPSRGGSELAPRGTNLLLAEYMFMIHRGLIVVVIQNLTGGTYYHGEVKQTNPRVPVILFTVNANNEPLAVRRLHYKMSLDAVQLMAYMNAERAPVEENPSWRPIDGTARGYIPHQNAVAASNVARIKAIRVKMEKLRVNNANLNPQFIRLQEDLNNMNAFAEFIIPPGQPASAGNVILPQYGVQPYDALHPVEDDLPPPHCYANFNTAEEINTAKYPTN